MSSTNQVAGDDTEAGFDFDTFIVVEVPDTDYTRVNGADIINVTFDPSKKGNIHP